MNSRPVSDPWEIVSNTVRIIDEILSVKEKQINYIVIV